MRLHTAGAPLRSLTVVIPARNEAPRVGRVVAAARAANPEGFDLRHVVVVDDGSSDATAAVAEASGAQVLRRPDTGGSKGAAMAAALDVLDSEYLLFLDADCRNLTPAAIERLCRPVSAGEADVSLGTFDYGMWNRLTTMFPITTGERLIPRSLLEAVRDRAQGYTIETFLSEEAGRRGYHTASQVLNGVRQTTKREKLGRLRGWALTVAMFRELALCYREQIDRRLYLRYLREVRVIAPAERRVGLVRANVGLWGLGLAASLLARPEIGRACAMLSNRRTGARRTWGSSHH